MSLLLQVPGAPTHKIKESIQITKIYLLALNLICLGALDGWWGSTSGPWSSGWEALSRVNDLIQILVFFKD